MTDRKKESMCVGVRETQRKERARENERAGRGIDEIERQRNQKGEICRRKSDI